MLPVPRDVPRLRLLVRLFVRELLKLGQAVREQKWAMHGGREGEYGKEKEMDDFVGDDGRELCAVQSARDGSFAPERYL